MGKKVSLSTHLRQNDTLKNIKYKIDQTYGAIFNTYKNIERLKRELTIQSRNRDFMYANKIEWEKKLATIISNIETEEKVLANLKAEHKRLTDIYNSINANSNILIITNRTLQETTHQTDKTLKQTILDNRDVGIRQYNDIGDQNKTMYNTIIDLKNDLTTHDKKTFNQHNNHSEYINLNTGLFYLYYILAIILAYFIYVKRYIINKYVFVFVFVLLIFYPYYILNVENYIYRTITYLWALIKAVPYTNE